MRAGDLIWLERELVRNPFRPFATRRRGDGVQASDGIGGMSLIQRSVGGSSKRPFPNRATCKDFVGYGDADPSNVSSLVHGAEMRVAETRAVNRALRKAYGIGICSVEEIGSLDRQPPRPLQSRRNSLRNLPMATATSGTEGPRPPLPDHSPA